MALIKVGNRVLLTTTTTGTGTYTLGAAVTGYNAMAAGGISNGDRVSYAVVDSLTNPTGTAEICEGVWNSSAGTLTRASVFSGSARNWPAGTKYIALLPHAGRLVLFDSDGNLILPLGLFAGSATINGTLGVTGRATLTAGMDITAGGIVIGGGVTSNGDLGVTGAATVLGALTAPALGSFQEGSGWHRRPGGKIAQRGSNTTTPGGGVTVSLPVAFGNTDYKVTITPIGASGPPASNSWARGTITTTSFDVWASQGGAPTALAFDWTAEDL